MQPYYLIMPDLSSIECIALKSKLPYSMMVLLLFCPMKSNSSFLKMHKLLTSPCPMSTNNIIVGGMNIYVDNPSCHFAVEFLNLIGCLGQKQIIDVPTYNRVSTLDLYITDSAPIDNLQVYDLVSMDLTFCHALLNLSVKCFFETGKALIQPS